METKFVADESSWSMEGSCRYGAGGKLGNINSMRVLQGTPMKAFTCKYCSRVFLNSRGLGGHQNLHKREKRMMLAMGVVPKSHGKKTIMLEKMEISSRGGDPSKPAAGVVEPNNHNNNNNRSGNLTYWSMPPTTDAADATNILEDANYTGMCPPDAPSSSRSSPQLTYHSGFVHNLDLDLHL